MTYGELPEALRLIVVPHEWDNKNISEQRDYAVARWSEIETEQDSLKAERDAARQAHDDAKMELTEADYFLGSLKAEHAALKQRIAEFASECKSGSITAGLNAECQKVNELDRRQCFGVHQAYGHLADELAALSSSQAPQEPGK